MVEELHTQISQEFTVENNKRYKLEAIIPHLYVHDTPAGTFTLTLYKDVTSIFSKSFTVSDIRTSLSTSDDFIHVFYPIIPASDVYIEAGDYQLLLTKSGYTYSDSNYLGWCRNFETQDYIDDQQLFKDQTNALETRFKVKL